MREVKITLGETWKMESGGVVRTAWRPGKSELQPVTGGRQLEHEAWPAGRCRDWRPGHF